MKTIFGLFNDFDSAVEAVDELARRGFTTDEMNVLVLRETVRNWMDVNKEQIKTEKNAGLDEAGYGGTLERLLGGEQPVNTHDLGAILASGQIADIMAQTAASPGKNGGMEGVMVSFSIPETAAQAYFSGIQDGGLLLFLRTEDEQASQAAVSLRELNAQNVSST